MQVRAGSLGFVLALCVYCTTRNNANLFTANVYGHADPRRAKEAGEKVEALLWSWQR